MLQPSGIFYRVKEHCLMGIKGTVRRSTDGDFIHANIDIDLLIDEEREVGNAEKPHELFDIVERFCLGRRRLVSFYTPPWYKRTGDQFWTGDKKIDRTRDNFKLLIWWTG